jgi:hypothetical protein
VLLSYNHNYEVIASGVNFVLIDLSAGLSGDLSKDWTNIGVGKCVFASKGKKGTEVHSMRFYIYSLLGLELLWLLAPGLPSYGYLFRD